MEIRWAINGEYNLALSAGPLICCMFKKNFCCLIFQSRRAMELTSYLKGYLREPNSGVDGIEKSRYTMIFA